MLPVTPKSQEVYEHDLLHDLVNSDRMRELVCDDYIATDLYGAMCNVRWVKLPVCLASRTAFVLSTTASDLGNNNSWTASFRYAAEMIAIMRNIELKNCAETYLDWYLSADAGYGHITEQIAEELLKIGWIPFKYED